MVMGECHEEQGDVLESDGGRGSCPLGGRGKPRGGGDI